MEGGARHTRWAFWLEWVSVTVVGSVIVSGLAFALTKLLGHVGLDQVDSSTEYLVVLPAVSISVGLMQWLVLRHHVRRAGWWVVAAALASAVSGLLLGDPGPPTYPAPYWLHLLLGLPTTMIFGSVLAGLVQWWILRRQARWPGLYVVVSAVAWGVALIAAAFAFNRTLFLGMGPALTVWGIVCGVVYGAITGLMLTVLLPHPGEPRSRSLLVAGGAVTLVVALMAVCFLGTSMSEEKLLRQYQAGKRDFSGVKLPKASLPGASLSGVVLRRADLTRANLNGADLSGSILTVANLGYADLSGADLSGSDLRGAYLRGASLRNASLHAANLVLIADPAYRCVRVASLDLAVPSTSGTSGPKQEASPWLDDLSRAGLTGAALGLTVRGGANLSAGYLLWVGLPKGSTAASHLSLFEPVVCRTNLSDADLRGADLSDADLHEAWLQEANLEGANLHSADLLGVSLQGVNLEGVNLEGANLRGASLVGADLSDQDLHGVNLSGADLRWASLQGANLYGADLSGADLYRSDLSDVDLSWADLTGANVTAEQLAETKSLEGATLPDGTKHE
jgi:uncharacterized protein YjbI with pentapeptide repeats